MAKLLVLGRRTVHPYHHKLTFCLLSDLPRVIVEIFHFANNHADAPKIFAFHSPHGILRYGGPPSRARVDGRMRPSLRVTWNCAGLTRPKIIYFRPGFPAVLLIR